MVKTPECPYIVVSDISPHPADPKYDVSFAEDLSEADRQQACEYALQQKSRHYPDVSIYIHKAEVERLLREIVKMGPSDQEKLIAWFATK